VQDVSPVEAPALRAVTPLGIVAANLARLRARGEALAYGDAAFVALLAETTRLATGLEDYLARSTTPASPDLSRLAADTVSRAWPNLFADGDTAIPLEAEMLSGHVEGTLLNFLVRATRATRVLEIGLFTGYSALAMAEALPDDGRLVACEIDAYAASVARAHFDASPHGKKIRIEVRPALETLHRLRDAGERFDFAFVDADKGGYAAYFDVIVGSTLLAENGLVCVDNTLMQGEPYLRESRTANGQAIADFNALVAADPRVEQVLLPIRDGLTLIRRVSP
jgi:caffeoyl-CoA O-methyltransferase